ncbi:unnamed protein product [Soboliphyme baturini]|uniref:Tubulin--tyrosine ligase-like protein 12 n=1 Tax=Soboliphyme baturini TaxID=241478 RepID=A0A183J1K2_9BILA|nr:unnamed protein product [Soboliphyme baturini]
MCEIMDIERNDGVSDTKVTEYILRHLWQYSQTYSIYNYIDDEDLEDRLPIWYVMDELGCRIQHSDHPNVRVVPFYYLTGKITYSLLFPVEHINAQEEITRDYVAGSLYHRADWREFYLLPWIHKDFSEGSCHSAITDAVFSASRISDSMPDMILPTRSMGSNECRKVFSESQKVREMLKHPAFQFVDSEEDADVFWYNTPFKDFNRLLKHNPNVLINQFPFEHVLTVKDLLAALIKSHYSQSQVDPATLEMRPSWLCTTYSLEAELPQFVSYFQQRAKKDLDNHWIIKPFNLSHSMDTYITDEIGQIIRLMDSGPKVACKYIEDPVLFYRDDLGSWVKFDMGFIVLLKSVEPLTLYLYDRFLMHFALKSFDLKHCDDVEKHFTVFNYLKEKKVKQVII